MHMSWYVNEYESVTISNFLCYYEYEYRKRVAADVAAIYALERVPTVIPATSTVDDESDERATMEI